MQIPFGAKQGLGRETNIQDWQWPRHILVGKKQIRRIFSSFWGGGVEEWWVKQCFKTCVPHAIKREHVQQDCFSLPRPSAKTGVPVFLTEANNQGV